MPTKRFSGIYRLVDKEWGGREALRLFFQEVGGEAEPFFVPVWFRYDYKPYRGAGPSFKRDINVGDVLMIEMGESSNQKPLLMAASKIDDYPIPENRQEYPTRPTRPPCLIRKNPKLDAAVYMGPSGKQLYYLMNLREGDVIHEVQVNGSVDSYPYPMLHSMVFDAEAQAEQIGSERFLLTIKIQPSYYAESNEPGSIIDDVRAQYIQSFPNLAAQDFAYVRRSSYGMGRYVLCWSIIKDGTVIKLGGIREVTRSIYDDTLISEE